MTLFGGHVRELRRRVCVCVWLENVASQNETLNVPFASTVNDMDAIFTAIAAPRSKHMCVAHATCQLGMAGSVHGAGGRVATGEIGTVALLVCHVLLTRRKVRTTASGV